MEGFPLCWNKGKVLEVDSFADTGLGVIWRGEREGDPCTVLVVYSCLKYWESSIRVKNKNHSAQLRVTLIPCSQLVSCDTYLDQEV